MTKAKDLTGKKFGRLLVLSRNYERQNAILEEKKRHVAYWNCKCDCGNLTITASSNLLGGVTRSCGCLAKERQRIQKNTKNIKWSKNGNVIIGTTRAGDQFTIDSDVFDLVKDYCWRKDAKGYIVANSKNGKNKTIKIHRLIMGVLENPEIIIDHKNWDKTNNQKANLRCCTKGQNNTNIKRKRNNTTGYTGVQKVGEKYQAKISLNGVRYYLGTFENKEDAIEARHKAETIMHGEWSGEYNRNDYKKALEEAQEEEVAS